MVKKSKRGSLSLSINAIVVLILAITMLGLGLAFMTTMFDRATRGLADSFDQLSSETEKRMEQDASWAAISSSATEMGVRDTKPIVIGLKNYDPEDSKTFTISLEDCSVLGTTDRDSNQCGKLGEGPFRVHVDFPEEVTVLPQSFAPVQILLQSEARALREATNTFTFSVRDPEEELERHLRLAVRIT